MANNSQMNENERGIFSINGITGMLIATVLLLSILAVLQVLSVKTQSAEATTFYKLNQDINAIKFDSKDNYKYYEEIKK